MTSTTTNPTRKGAIMAKTFRPGTARWLSSQGHPGYGATFAKAVLAYLVERDLDPTNHHHVWAGVAQTRHAW